MKKQDRSTVIAVLLVIFLLSIPCIASVATNNAGDLPPEGTTFVLNYDINDKTPRFMRYRTENSGLNRCFLIIDRQTNVMYLQYSEYDRAYAFPLLDSDGKPLLYEAE